MPRNGASKPIPMDIFVALWQYVFRKNIRNPAEVQQPTNDVPKAKKPPFHWPPKYHKIFTDCVEELKKEGISMFFSPLILIYHSFVLYFVTLLTRKQLEIVFKRQLLVTYIIYVVFIFFLTRKMNIEIVMLKLSFLLNLCF